MAELDTRSIDPSAGAEPLKRRLREALLIGLLALTLNLSGNGRTSLWDRDEPRYAASVREMRERGDWLRPTFNGQPRYHKPILIYWLMRVGVAVGGDNAFGLRLMSGLAGAGTCLLVWGMGRRLFGPRVGLFAALFLAASPIMFVESKLATTDATLALFLVGCQFCLWELGRRASPWLAACFWGLLALSVLLKGPVGPAMLAAANLASWGFGGPTSCWRRLHWRRGLLGFALAIAPWYVAIGFLTNWGFYKFALGEQGVGRITAAIEQHGGFPGYYVITGLGMFYPWSTLLPAALLGAWTRRKGRPELGFLLGWIVGPLVLLECVQTKLVHYYLPAIPACALLAAWLASVVSDDVVNLRRWPLGRLGFGLLAGMGLGATVALLSGAVVFPSSLRWPCLVMALALGGGTLYAVDRIHSGATERAMLGLAACWSFILLTTAAWLLPAAEPYRIARIVGERLAVVSAREQATPMLGDFQQPGAIYSLGRPAATMRDANHLYDVLSREPVVMALMHAELIAMRKDSKLELDERETVRGFNLDKGRTETLRLTVIRPRVSAIAGRGEKRNVK